MHIQLFCKGDILSRKGFVKKTFCQDDILYQETLCVMKSFWGRGIFWGAIFSHFGTLTFKGGGTFCRQTDGSEADV